MAPTLIQGLRRRFSRLNEQALGTLFGTVVGVDIEQPWVALTFDDGPHPVATPRILDVLAGHGAHATFFMVGSSARRYPELVERVAAAGHAIGHHTLDHVSLVGLDRAARRRQILGGAAAIGPLCSPLFRPPYGHLDLATWWLARRHGHDVIAWSGHAFDWKAQDVATLAGRLRAAMKPGAIVLLHDAPQAGDAEGDGRDRLVAALDTVLGEVTQPHVVRFVTLPDLLAGGRPRRRRRWRAGAPGVVG